MTSIESNVGRLRAQFDGALLVPGEDEYDEARAVWNAMIDKRPAVVAQCRSVADVVAALRFAQDNDLPVAVRGGGHSAAGKGTCDGGLVIDLSPMNEVTVDADARTARAEGGATWGAFDAATQAHGLATTGGVVSTTGIGGLTLGGGFGWLTRRFSLACDNLISVELVTADGKQLVCSEDSHPDLFWALRGGGGNFGVATAFTYRLHPVGPEVYGGILGWPLDQAREVLAFHREATRDAPDELGMTAVLIAAPPLEFVPEHLHGKPALMMLFCWSGEPADGHEVMRQWLDLGPPDIQLAQVLPYTVMQSLIDPLQPPGRRVYWKSGYLAEFTDEAIDTAVTSAAQTPSPFNMGEFVLWGGAVSRIGSDESAFGDRGGRFLYNSSATWEDPADDQANIAWARHLHDSLQPHATGGVYVNFLSEEGPDRVRAAYGDAKYTRLAEIKARYDPGNVFAINQNIEPAS